MAEPNLATLIARERRRLDKRRSALLTRRKQLDSELADVEREVAAVEAYETAKGMKSGPRKKSAARKGGRRGGSRRQSVVDLIAQHPEGIGRADILVALGVKGDKPAEQSVSNALTALKKNGQIAATDGKYRSAAA